MLQRSFKKIGLLRHAIKRKSLNDFYWPDIYKNLKSNQLLLQRKWFEGWICNFCEKGLGLQVTYFVTKDQLENWDDDRKNNINITTEELQFYDSYEFIIPEYQLSILHNIKEAEGVRKEVYISDKFKENADQMWAAQFFLNDDPDPRMIYCLGFDREISDADFEIVNNLKKIFIGQHFEVDKS
ncbi:MAG: hypothetical protein WA160_05575 [Pseudobdellovibrio sp.]